MSNWNLGWIPPGLQDTTNEKFVDISSRVFEEIRKIANQNIYFGRWSPQRDPDGNPTNFKVKCSGLIDRHMKIFKRNWNDELESSSTILVPLNKAVRSDNKKLELNLDEEMLRCFSPSKNNIPSLAFDGKNDYVEILHSISIDFNKDQEFTIEVRVQVSSFQPDSKDEDNDIIEKWRGFGPYPYVIRYNNRSGKIIAAQYGSDDNPSEQPQLCSKKSINDGVPHHIAFVKTKDNLSLYIDGKKEAETQDKPKGETKNSSPLYIGCRGGYRNYFKGEISEVRIWEISLDEQRIEEFNNNKSITNPETEPGLVGYWSFNYDEIDDQYKQDNVTLARNTIIKNKTKKRSNGKIYGEPSWIIYQDWSSIETQGALKSCTAHAAISLFEYFQRKESGKHIDGSRLFLYKVARNFRSLEKERYPGASIAETMAAMLMVGVPPEEYWPYHPFLVDQEPSPFCYSIARNYRVTSCFRLDFRAEVKKIDLLDQIKIFIAAGFPPMFGFPLDDSTAKSAKLNQGKIPFKFFNNQYESGHALVAVGYCDEIKIVEEFKNLCKDESEKQEFQKAFEEELTKDDKNYLKKFLDVNDTTVTSTGAFLVRNSWGNDWGEQGYGWLPYAYILTGLAVDWWSLLKAEWMETESFGLVDKGEGILGKRSPLDDRTSR